MTTVTTDDPLAALVVSARSVDRERLASALDSWARIDPHENLIRFLPGATEKGTIKQLILVALLGQMAINLLADQQREGMTPSELAQCTGVGGSSLRPQLKALADGGIVLKNDRGKYVVPSHAFEHARMMLEDDDG
ncbi:MAG: hypothetical protein OXG58_09135 [Gemmatimonadetes bacterium]|nr:hypothetical protein [Gemmatimonadota bacterium]